jgi:hypothetical protein
MNKTASQKYTRELKICGRPQRVQFFYKIDRLKHHILRHLLNKREYWNQLIAVLHISKVKNELKKIGCDLEECRTECTNEYECNSILGILMNEYMETVFECIHETQEYRPLHTHNIRRHPNGKYEKAMYFACDKGLVIVIRPLYIVRTAYRPANTCATTQEFYDKAIDYIWKRAGGDDKCEKWCPSELDWHKEVLKTKYRS